MKPYQKSQSLLFFKQLLIYYLIPNLRKLPMQADIKSEDAIGNMHFQLFRHSMFIEEPIVIARQQHPIQSLDSLALAVLMLVASQIMTMHELIFI